MDKQLIGILKLSDAMNNKSILDVFIGDMDRLNYSYYSKTGTPYSLSNLQCGWQGPELPFDLEDFKNNKHVILNVVKAVNGGTQKVCEYKILNEKKVIISKW